MLTWIAAGIAGALVLWMIARSGSSDPSALRPSTPEARGRLEAEYQQALATGRKIDAIKAYRRLHGTDLKDSKDAVERAMAGLA
jgi:ribosomal protein L7/L12